jgi:hypothetical protein
MIGKKGKRTLVFENREYVWFVKKTDDIAFLSISSVDKKQVLLYRVNQIGDDYIHPKISILQSEKLAPGVYSFFPPLADESISANTIRSILKWVKLQTEESRPLEKID